MMNKSEAKELLDSFELYAHDEYGETFVSQIKDDFLKWKYGNDQDVGIIEMEYSNIIEDIYQVLGKFGKDREDIKKEFRSLCEYYKTIENKPIEL